MCLEIYSPFQPVQIPYENERIRFLSPSSMSSRYTLLVRNAGFEDLSELNALYPRALIQLVLAPDGTQTQFVRRKNHGWADVTDRLPAFAPFSIGQPNPGDTIAVRMADPNNPIGFLPNISGTWHPGGTLDVMPNLPDREKLILQSHEFTPLIIKLAAPIQPGEAQWLCLEVIVDQVGCPIDTFFARVVFHELTSPIDVRRTIGESLHTAVRDTYTNPQAQPDNLLVAHRMAYRGLISKLGLNRDRQVDIQYYELSVQTGDPLQQYLFGITRLGDIRPRPGSPRIGIDPQRDREFLNEPIYEWKSGSIIEPAHPWRNTGFSIRLNLACPRPASTTSTSEVLVPERSS